MSFDQTAYPGAANLLGNVEISRNVAPILRSRKRRLDPDGSSAVPYYPSANGKTLRVGYTADVSTVVTPATTDIALTGDGIAVIINDINTFATTESLPLQAIDLDGFIAIRNVNPGKTHYVRIDVFTDSPSDDAAPVLGFSTFPLPGSISFAGEIAATPGSRVQSNPQTTALISKDDTLGGAELNRPLAAILQMVDNLRAELNRDVVVYRDVSLTFSAHATDGVISARINDDNIRVFYPKFPVADIPHIPKDLNPYHRVLDSFGNIAVQDFHSGAFNPNSIQVQNFFYATGGTPFTPNAVFSTWGTPDGGTIVADSVPNKNKQAATSITSIIGNIVECSSATFVTKKVMAGDPVELVATTLLPFDHSGWFAVDGVIDETHLAIRPMAVAEETPNGSSKRPRWLNPSAGGTLRVAMGRFIPAGDLYVSTTQTSLAGGGAAHVVRLAVGVPFIKTLTDDRARDLSGGLDAVSTILGSHLNATSEAHPASAILGFTSATTWADTTTITGVTIKNTIEDILTDLSSTGAQSGSGKIGSAAISIGGSTPNTLALGTIRTQLTALLTALQTHVVQASGAHAASAITYAGGPAWHDGITNGATTVEAQLDKIVSDLAGDGAGANKISIPAGPNWADGTTNPANSVALFVYDIISALAGAGSGSRRISSDAVGSDLTADTLFNQIGQLASGWLKMSRVNTISAAQTFTAVITANGGLTGGNNQNVKVVGTGRYGHDNMVLAVPAAAFHHTGVDADFVMSLSHWEFAGTFGGNLYASVVLPVGTRIRSISSWCRKNGHANSLDVSLSKISLNISDFTDTTTSIASTADTGTSFNLSVVTSSTVNYTVEANVALYLTVFVNVSGVHFQGVQITYDFPV